MQNVTPINNETIDYNEMITVDAHTVFPEVVPEPGKVNVVMRAHRHDDVPTSPPMYIPDVDVFKYIMVWWNDPDKTESLPCALKGHTGTGKTEMWRYICDRLNEPMYTTTVTKFMTIEHLQPMMQLVTDEHGNAVSTIKMTPAAKGYEHGGLILFDEIDKADEDLQVGLYPLLCGHPWVCDSVGKTIHKHPNTRIAGASNTSGEGGSDLYTTSGILDTAFRNRWGWLNVDYMSPEDEQKVIRQQYPHLPYMVIRNVVRTANAFRDAMFGKDRKGYDGTFTAPFSTRTAMRWCKYMMLYDVHRHVKASLDFVYEGSVNSDQLTTYETIIESIWGDELLKPLSYHLEKEKNEKKS